MSEQVYSSSLQALGDHIVVWLERKVGTSVKEQFSAYIEDGEIVPSFKNMGDGVIACYFKYKASFSIEGIQYGLINQNALIARIIAWLSEHDTTRTRFKLGNPVIDIDAYDSSTMADIDIEVHFVDVISMREVTSGLGDVEYNGKQWDIEPYVIHTAEEGEVKPNDISN